MSLSTKTAGETTPLLTKYPPNDGSLLDGNETNNILERQCSSPPDLNVDKHIKNETNRKGFKFSSLPLRKKYVLILCTLANFLAGCSFSLIAPFYPLVAEKKGMTPTLVGFVFSSYEGVIFLSSPFMGNYLTTIGAKFLYLSGIFVGGVCKILFGTLDKGPDGTSFIVMSVLCRSIEAVGVSAFLTASFAIVSSEFSDSIGTVFAILETGLAMGLMIGPPIGGVLYGWGGYGFPFYLIGALVLLNGISVYKFLPEPHTVQRKRKRSIFKLLRNPMVFLPMMSVFAGTSGITGYGSTFAKHLEPFGLSSAVNGLFFMVGPLMYASMANVWGYITDTKDIQAPLIIGGHLVFGLGFMFLGPSFLLPFVPYAIWVLTIGLFLMGVSSGCLLIPTLKCMLKGARETSNEDSLDTNAMISGLYNSVEHLGGFVGPTAVSALVEHYDYPIGYSAIAGFNIFMMLVTLVYFSIRRFRNKQTSINDRLGTSDAMDISNNPARKNDGDREHLDRTLIHLSYTSCLSV